jgi:hypothetical protein
MPKSKNARRNPVAISPLLRKGGPHTQSKTGQRVQSRMLTLSAANRWLDAHECDDELAEEEPQYNEEHSSFNATLKLESTTPNNPVSDLLHLPFLIRHHFL